MRTNRKISAPTTKIDVDDPVREKTHVQESKQSETAVNIIEVLSQKSVVTAVVVPTKQKSSVGSTKTFSKIWKRLKSRRKKPKETIVPFLSVV
jgi:hypothetical protein